MTTGIGICYQESLCCSGHRAHSVCEGEECSRCFFGERWGCSCVTEMFTWRFGMTQNCHQDKNIPKQNRKLLNGVKSLLKANRGGAAPTRTKRFLHFRVKHKHPLPPLRSNKLQLFFFFFSYYSNKCGVRECIFWYEAELLCCL